MPVGQPNLAVYRCAVTAALLGIAGAAAAQTAAPIPRAAFLNVMDAEFRQMDADRNGQVTRAEVEAFQRMAAVAEAAARNRALFAQLDTDRNGQISPAEFAKATAPAPINAQPAIAEYDANRNGQISQIEIGRSKSAHSTASTRTRMGLPALPSNARRASSSDRRRGRPFILRQRRGGQE